MSNQPSANGRRNFLKSSIAGLAGAAVLPSMLKADDKTQAKQGKQKLVFRTLGKTGIKVPVVSIGAQATNPEIYKAALDAGLTHLDTAESYNRGNHETMLGEIIKTRPRDSYVIGTKAYDGVNQRTGLVKEGTTADNLVKKFEGSLKRLGVDYVEILYLHAASKAQTALYPPFLEAFQKLKKQGKIRAIGVTTHTNEPEVIMAAADSGVYDVVLTAYNFRQPHLAAVEKAIAHAAKKGLGIVAMKTQAGTFWDRERQQKINMAAALKWTLQNPNVHTTIPGFRTFDELREDISIMENLALTPKEKADLKLGEKQALAGLYCSQCEKCLPQCPADIHIPTLMRSYMYAYGHKNPSKAKQALEMFDLSRVACSDCSTCRVKCSMNFDIKDRVQDIARLAQVPDDFLV